MVLKKIQFYLFKKKVEQKIAAYFLLHCVKDIEKGQKCLCL